MALVNGTNYDHIDLQAAAGGNVTRHKLQDTDGRAMIASAEASSTAGAAHGAGTYFVYGGVLYKALKDIAPGAAIVTSGEGQNCQAATVGGELSELGSDLAYNEYRAKSGYTLTAEDMESGTWGYSVKGENPKRLRTNRLIPVSEGAEITYTNPTMRVFFGVLESPGSSSFAQFSGWNNAGAEGGKYAINTNGYLAVIVDSVNDITVEDFDSTIVIKQNLMDSAAELYMRSGSTTMITTDRGAANLLNGDADNASVNTVYSIGAGNLNIANLPNDASYSPGMLLTLGFRKGDLNGKSQMFIRYSNGKIYTRSKYVNVWTAWTETAAMSDLTDYVTSGALASALTGLTSLVTNTMVLSNATANALFGQDFDNLLPNKVYSIGQTGLTIAHTPYQNFIGSVMCVSFRETDALSGRMQIAVALNSKLYTRFNSGGEWRDWIGYANASDVTSLASRVSALEETVYNVGPARTNTSLVALLKTIQTDTSPKVIYMDEGEYDIFQEYKDNQIPSPPADVQAANYFSFNVFLPKNTRLVGIGNVVLKWQPTSEQITRDESRTWSPLNLWYGNNVVENITIDAKNCRYCIHDDSHNAYTGFTNVYRNVRCICHTPDTGLGFGNVTGFGFEDQCTYLFENCVFTYDGTGNFGVLYGHDGYAGGTNIICNNCVFIGGTNANARTIRLQSLRADDSNRILTSLNGCYIQGGIHLDQYNESAGQFFDVTLLHSGNPTQTIDIGNDNPYPVKVYQ